MAMTSFSDCAAATPVHAGIKMTIMAKNLMGRTVKSNLAAATAGVVQWAGLDGIILSTRIFLG